MWKFIKAAETLPTDGLSHDQAGKSEAGWQPLEQAVALDKHWGKPDHLEDVLGTYPVGREYYL